MRRLNILYVVMAAVCCLLTGCDEVDKADRLVYVKPAEVSRAVLIEDFTGQRCLNCPNATEEIKHLQEQYGSDKVIAVGIHGGALAVYTNSKVKGLRTTLGDDYNTYWNVEAWPTGLVDRRGKPTTPDQWAGMVRTELEKTSPVELSVATLYDGSTRTLTIDTHALSSQTMSGKLQLWLTEDAVVAPQQMPDNTMNYDYVHNHVLRACISDVWGDQNVITSTEAGSTFSKTYTFHVSDNWRPNNCWVAAFVNDYGTDVMHRTIANGTKSGYLTNVAIEDVENTSVENIKWLWNL